MKRVIVCAIAAILSLAGYLCGQGSLSTFPASFSHNLYQVSGYVPSTPAALATRDVALIYLRFANDHASNTGTIRVIDGTTNCGGSGCPIVPDVSIAPKTVYLFPLPASGELVKGGITWSVTGSATVVGYAQLKY